MLLVLCPEWPEKWSQSIKFPKFLGGHTPRPPYNWHAYARFPPGQCLALPLHFSLLRSWLVFMTNKENDNSKVHGDIIGLRSCNNNNAIMHFCICEICSIHMLLAHNMPLTLSLLFLTSMHHRLSNAVHTLSIPHCNCSPPTVRAQKHWLYHGDLT